MSCCAAGPGYKRFILAYLSCFGLAVLFAMRCEITLAIIVLNRNCKGNCTNGRSLSDTVFGDPITVEWTRTQIGLMEAAFFVGYAVFNFPAGFVATIFPSHAVLGLSMLCTFTLNLVIPALLLLKTDSFYPIMAIRILQGMVEGCIYPGIVAFWRLWAPPSEKSKLVTTSFLGISLGPIIGYPLTGTVIHDDGVRLVFIIYGVTGVLWCGIWFLVARERPNKDNWITEAERDYIENSRPPNYADVKCSDVPWKPLFTSAAVWAIISANIGRNFTFQFAQSGLPHFLEDVYHTNQEVTGHLMAIPFIFMAVCTPLSGIFADAIMRKQFMSVVNTRRFLTGFGYGLLAVSLVLLGFIKNLAASVTFIALGLGSISVATTGFAVNQLDVAPRFAGILMGLSNGIATVSGVIAPIVAKKMDKHKWMSEWRNFFFISAAVSTVSLTIYCIFAKGEEQEWAKGSPAPPEGQNYGTMDKNPADDTKPLTQEKSEKE